MKKIMVTCRTKKNMKRNRQKHKKRTCLTGITKLTDTSKMMVFVGGAFFNEV